VNGRGPVGAGRLSSSAQRQRCCRRCFFSLQLEEHSADSQLKGSQPSRQRRKRDDRSRLHALFLISGVAVIFWLAFQQTGASLAFFAQAHTVRRVGFLRWSLPLRPGHFAALHAGLVIAFTPLVLWAFGRLRQRRVEPSTSLKMIWGFLFTAAAFAIVAGASLSAETRAGSARWGSWASMPSFRSESYYFPPWGYRS